MMQRSESLSMARGFAPPRGRPAVPAADSAAAGGAALVAALVAGHAVLALLMDSLPLVSTGHAFAVCAVAAGAAAFARVENVVTVVAYLAGSEVLWRMTDARVPWDTVKYLLPLVLLCAGIRVGRSSRVALPAYFYFVLLLPSLLLTLSELSGRAARVQVTFYLMGPLGLAAAAWFFSTLDIDPAGFRRFVLAFLAPVTGVASIAIYSTATAEQLRFRAGSNFVTSGGFGPNQVSSALGLAALLVVLFLLTARATGWLRTLLVVTVCVLVGQGLLTFSRGGIWGAAIPAVLSAAYLARDRRVRVQVIGSAAVLSALVAFVLLPRLDVFTQGALSERFADRGTTHRAEFMRLDLETWMEHPVMGVGPGMGKSERASAGFVDFASHTEYTRMVAEHGIFGLAALVLVLGIAVARMARAAGPADRALAAALLAWALVYMAHAGTRTAAPAVVFGLAMARFAGHGRPPAAVRRERHTPPARLSPVRGRG